MCETGEWSYRRAGERGTVATINPALVHEFQKGAISMMKNLYKTL